MKRFVFTLALLCVTASVFSQHAAFRVLKSGKGTPVLFLPGFASPGSVWNETIRNLKVRKEAHVISYAGFNGITSIDTPWYDAIKTQLVDYIQKEKLSKLTIIGHSMGGNLAVDIAAVLPGKIEKLILVDAIPCMKLLMMPGVQSKLSYNNPYNQQLLKMPDEAFKQTAGMMARNMTSNRSKMDTLINWTMKADRKTYVYGYTDLLNLDLRATLKSVKAPTLILGASYPDVKTVTATFEQQYALLASKVIVIAKDSKHFVMFDQPVWLYEQVNSFLINE